MKKIVLAITFLSLISQPAFSGEIASSQWNGYGKISLALVLSYATLIAWSKTFEDMGYRHLFSKQRTNIFERDLREDSDGLLSEQAIKFWGKIQYLSTIPKIWWREIVAGSFSIFLGYWATMLIKNGIRDIRLSKIT